MLSRYSKKGRSPGSVDNWLDSLGYYRKNIAYDETCLFRAISEQMFLTQLHHEKIRTACVKYGIDHFEEFNFLYSNVTEWYDRLHKLRMHMAVCGTIEMKIISRCFKYDIMLFDAGQRCVENITDLKVPNSLLLCRTSEDHYDVVYKKEYISAAGFCQSIMYKMLYEDVMQVPNVLDIAHNMLYESKSHFSTFAATEVKSEASELGSGDAEDSVEELLHNVENLVFTDHNQNDKLAVAPFPFKIAKALDPNIYRNIEYDTWLEIRRELRLGEWYYGDNNLILGTRCITRINGVEQHCYIQEILKETEQCIVYLIKKAERHTVNYNELRPEDDAKPWPLPYRFCRTVAPAITAPIVTDEQMKVNRKNKGKKRDKKHSESSAHSASSNPPTESSKIDTVSAYEGCPLQMQPVNDKVVDSKVNYMPSQVQQVQVTTEDVGSSWLTHWNQHVQIPSPHEPLTVQTASTGPHTPFCFSTKSMQLNNPPPPPVSYVDTPPTPLYYNNYANGYTQPGMWTNADSAMSPDVGYTHNNNNEDYSVEFSPGTCIYYSPDNAYPTPPIFAPPTFSPPTFPPPASERHITPLPPTTVDVMPFVFPPPGTQIYFPQSTRIQEVLMPSPPIPLFSPPPVDMQFVSPASYVYPPTPPFNWYQHPGVNSQGFIYPNVSQQGVHAPMQ